MALDTRDWYRDLLRRRTGYTERARFRRPQGELDREAATARRGRAWRPWRRAALAAATAILASAVYADMKAAQVPMTWAGLKWWLSLWMPI